MSDKVAKKSGTNKFAGLLAMSFFAITGVFYMLFSSAAAPGTPTFGLYLSPSTSTVTSGSQINVKVYANLSTNSVQSIAAYIHYDTTKLTLTSANQSGVDPNYTVTSRCTSLDGCKPAGEIVFVAGYSGTGSISAADGLLVGNMTFTSKSSGAAAVTLDPDTRLSGFTSPTISQTTLDSRSLVNATYTVTTSTTGGNTGGSTGGSTGSTGSTSTGGTTTKYSTTTKSTTSTGTSSGTSTGTSASTPSDSGSTPTDTNDQTTIAGTTSDQQNGSGGSGAATASTDPQKKTSKALILAASMAVSAIIVGTLALLLSEPVRTRIAHIFHHGGSQFYTPNDPLVMGGPGSTVASPPHNLNSPNEPSESIVIKPNSTTIADDKPASSISSSNATENSSTSDTQLSNSENHVDDDSDNIIKPTQPPTI